jgi:vacuolar-type H+-ATPase subunit H
VSAEVEEHSSSRYRQEELMKRNAATIALVLLTASGVRAQSLIINTTVGPNQIGQVKTTQGITTRVTFADTVRDIICGDLYDPATGKGSFVVQRIDNDVFLKPVVAKGVSNLFVKTGEKGEHTYSFDLLVVPLEQAHRVVHVAGDSSISGSAGGRSPGDTSEDVKKNVAASQQQVDETIRNARQQADAIISQANKQASEIYSKALQRAETLDHQSADRAQQEVEQRFVRAMIQGVREVKSVDSRVVAKKVSLALDPRVLTFDDRSYLRYTIRNDGDQELSFNGLSLERRTGKEVVAITAKVIQGRAQNKLNPGDAIMGVIMFNAKEVAAGDKLTLYVRGEDNTEIARLSIQ